MRADQYTLQIRLETLDFRRGIYFFLNGGTVCVIYASMSKLNVTTSTTRPASPNTGSIFFETDTNKLIFWDGTVWHLYDRDSVTAAAAPNTLQFDLTFSNTVNGYSEAGLTFAVDASHVSSAYAGAGALASYSADGVNSSGVKFYVMWEDNMSFSHSGSDYEWMGWSLFSSVDSGSTLVRELYEYSGMHMPFGLLTLSKYEVESNGGPAYSGWDHNTAAPFNLDLTSDNTGNNYYITYDGSGSSGDNSDQYEVSWDNGSSFSMSGGTDGPTFYSSRTGTVPS